MKTPGLGALWIKCTEQMPKEEGLKIIYAPSADELRPLIMSAWYGPHSEEGGLWVWHLMPYWAKGITHWMDLPPPPLKGPS